MQDGHDQVKLNRVSQFIQSNENRISTSRTSYSGIKVL